MNRSRRNWVMGLILVSMGLFFGACTKSTSGDTGKGGEQKEKIVVVSDEQEGTPDNPLTINVAYPWEEEQFNERFKPIEEALENVEIVFNSYNGTSEGLQELFAADVVPDIIISSPDDIGPLEDLEAIYPLDDLVIQEDFDLGRLNPSLVSLVKGYDSENRLIGFPDGTGLFALYYNKEVFDLFGEPYPDPNKPMTWQETLELSKKMTAERNNQMYIGLLFGGWGSTGDLAKVPLREFGIAMTDAKSGEVLLTKKPEFTRYLELMREYYNIPGMRSKDVLESDMFAQKAAAMTIHWQNYLAQGWGDLEYQENMDFAPVPVWEDQPTIGPHLGTAAMVVTSYSKNKVTAFRVLTEYVSTKSQINIVSTMSSGPAVLDPEVLDNFGAELDQYKDRNTKLFFELEPAELDNYSHFDRYVPFDLTKFADSDIDIPTFLREVEEEAEKIIEEAKVKN
ncbi:extracellular solute-binding protein [Lederbergia sp. NSJ-179]|uniref:ABC transporter substrate-binding protein n=1 Tax=Lederbergia sp. NSJ-179 TaxID=2931402 RepID=UPI001FD5072A|nr:extracellular solute-binding protein [Lederbergia sp. NSJ-179]MCJ7841548.1 extracellular solute-binding protein [Lederbergia sp. NSJ-179]